MEPELEEEVSLGEETVSDEGEIGEDSEETEADEGERVDGRLYARETPHNEAFPINLADFGYRFLGNQFMSCIVFPVNIYCHSFF